MKKRTYNAPSVEQEVVMVEQGIAVSTILIIEENTMLKDWEEGNTDWW